jgi:hypothetical protein
VHCLPKRQCTKCRVAYINTHTLSRTNTHTDPHMYMHMYMYMCMYVCMHVFMYVCIYVCMHACMYVCMHVCVYAYINKYIHIYMRIKIICKHYRRSCLPASAALRSWASCSLMEALWHVILSTMFVMTCFHHGSTVACHTQYYVCYDMFPSWKHCGMSYSVICLL